MKILVCVKQVPGSNRVEVDPETGVLKRNGVQSKINPYDLYAIESALSLAERFGGTVESLTMGPPQARSVIEECVCMGAEKGYVLSDRAFAGADVLATSYALSQGVKLCGPYDLILCGKQTTDGDTAQVGAELAEFLHLPHVAGVTSVDEITETEVFLTVTSENGWMKEKVSLPCLISMDADINTPRLPSYRIKKNLKEDCVVFYGLNDLPDSSPEQYGLKGSATQVERIFPPEKNSERIHLEGDADSQAQQLCDLLRRKKLI